MALAGIELRYLVNQISETVQDYYVSNIYGITKDSILFKLHHTEKDDIYLMISTTGIWLTRMKIEQIEPNKLQKRLRSDLLRLKLKKIEQLGAERVAYITFAGFDKEFILVGEFFGDGNIILCNNSMKILALQHSIDVRHRKLGVGLEYVQPPGNDIDVLDISIADFASLKASNLTAGKWLGRTLGLPKRYVEGIFGVAGIDPKNVGNQMSDSNIRTLYETTKEIVTNVASGVHEPGIIEGEKPEAVPVKIGTDKYLETESFMVGLDTVFTESLVNIGKSIHTSGTEKKINELQNQLSEQKKAISIVKEKSDGITLVANSLYKMIADGITTITDERAQEILKMNNADLVNEKGQSLLTVNDEKIQINTKTGLHSIASILFDAAKKQSGATNSIEQAIKKTEKKLLDVKSKAGTENSVLVSQIRKKNWYERYRWFFTTDGLLAVGGRDAASNSAVVRKQLGKNDRIFHGDIFGSPFFILKGGQNAPSASMSEIAHATVCFSRAWREGMYGLSAFWVNPEQVKRSAPSGQFLPKGSFTIEGQRNYIKAASLKLAVGIIKQDNDYVLTCGPPESIKKESIYYAIIEPHGTEMSDVAKKIRLEFLKINEEITKTISIDEFVRALPAGQSQIKEIGTNHDKFENTIQV